MGRGGSWLGVEKSFGVNDTQRMAMMVWARLYSVIITAVKIAAVQVHVCVRLSGSIIFGYVQYCAHNRPIMLKGIPTLFMNNTTSGLRNLSSKRVLVTGGAGFLGSHLCERLLADGHEVVCMDNYFTGNKQNIMHLMNNPRFELMRHDVTFPVYIEIDEIYNLACPASPIHYQHDPVQTTKTSVHGAINMLGLAKRTGAKIFQASTSEVYGDPHVHPQTEDYWGHVNPIGFRSCYDEGKRCAETLFFDYRRQHDLRIKVGRIFNTYGPRMHPSDGRVVSNFIMQALTGQQITIYGEGQQTRSFCYCLDLIEAFIRIMNTDDNFTGPVNIGNPDEFTIRQLAEKVIAMTNSSSELVFMDLPSDDPTQRRPDISMAKRELDWEPQVKLEQGLEKTIAYFAELLDAGDNKVHAYAKG